MWMLTSNFRALRAKFKDVSHTFKETNKDPEKLLEKRQAAWHEFIEEFVRVEIPDRLEMLNMQFGIPNPLTEKKLAVFEG
jgi:hypothetical protein